MQDIPIGQAIRLFGPLTIGIFGFMALGFHTIGELYIYFVLGRNINWEDYWQLNVLIAIFIFIGIKYSFAHWRLILVTWLIFIIFGAGSILHFLFDYYDYYFNKIPFNLHRDLINLSIGAPLVVHGYYWRYLHNRKKRQNEHLN